MREKTCYYRGNLAIKKTLIIRMAHAIMGKTASISTSLDDSFQILNRYLKYSGLLPYFKRIDAPGLRIISRPLSSLSTHPPKILDKLACFEAPSEHMALGCKIRKRISITLSLLYLLHVLVNTLVTSIQTRQYRIIVENLNWFIGQVSMALSLIIFHQKFNEIGQLLQDCSMFGSPYVSQVKLYPTVKHILIGFSIYSLVDMAFELTRYNFREIDEYFLMYFYGTNASQVASPHKEMIGHSLITLDVAFYTYMSDIERFLMVYYFAMALLIRYKIAEFNATIARLCLTNTASFEQQAAHETVSALNARFDETCHLVSSFESIFNVTLLAWFISDIANLIHHCQDLLTDFHMGTLSFDTGTALMESIASFVTATAITIVTASINDSFDDELTSVYQLSSRREFLSHPTTRHLFTLLREKMLHPPVAMTAAKLFKVSKSFIITILSGVVTYMAVIYDLDPDTFTKTGQ